jgi:hypothetical protein
VRLGVAGLQVDRSLPSTAETNAFGSQNRDFGLWASLVSSAQQVWFSGK